MERWYAVVLALPVVLGAVALSVRSPKPEPRPSSSSAMITPAPVRVEKALVPDVAETEDATPAQRDVARELERERLVADYEYRIELLIQSIDWTRAESRSRFPAEHDRITAEYKRAMTDAGY